MTYHVGNSGHGFQQEQKYGGIKLINVIPIPLSW